jgi:probable phosphoglycerate mutase
MEQQIFASKTLIREQKHLLLEFDGLCVKNPGGVACSAWAISSLDEEQPHIVLAQGKKVVAHHTPTATNNFAEYCGLGLGLKFLEDLGWHGELTVRGDSKLVIYQVQGKWQCKKPHIAELRRRILERLQKLDLVDLDFPLEINQNKCHLEWVSRENNSYTDALTKESYGDFIRGKGKK